MGSRKGTAVLFRMDPASARRLDELAEEDRRTRTAEVEWLVDTEVLRREDGVEPAVRVDRLELRIQMWRDHAAALRRQPVGPDETRERLDGRAEAAERAADEIEMEIRTRG